MKKPRSNPGALRCPVVPNKKNFDAAFSGYTIIVQKRKRYFHMLIRDEGNSGKCVGTFSGSSFSVFGLFFYSVKNNHCFRKYKRISVDFIVPPII